MPMDLGSSPPVERGLLGGLADSIDPPGPGRHGVDTPDGPGAQVGSTQTGPGSAPLLALPLGVKPPTAAQAEALALLLQEMPNSYPATLVLHLDPDGSAGLTGKDVKLWIDYGLAGAVA